MLTLEEAKFGHLKLTQSRITFQLYTPDDILLESAETNWCGGNIHLQATRLRSGRSNLSTMIYCDGVSLAQALRELGVAQTEGEGKLTGKIPVKLRRSGIFFENAYLYSEPGANGIIEALCSLLSKYDAEAVKAELAAAKPKRAAKTAKAAAAEPPQAEPVNTEAAEAVELKCAAELKDAVMAYLGASAQIVKEKGSNVIIGGQAVCDEAFYMQLIKWGSGVKLMEPAAHRKEFVKYCKKIISQYK